MNAEIIAVGSELLLGQIQNSNATYLSSELSKVGIDVYHHTVVGDNPQRLLDVVKNGLERADLLIFTGGLGPTKDDLTKETVGEATDTPLDYDPETEDRIRHFFAARKRNMTENNRKQALALKGAHIFPNDHGLACGMALEVAGKQLILLPGPPSEMIPMFETYTLPFLLKNVQQQEEIQSKVLRFFDIGESQLVERIDDLIEQQTNPTIAPLASGGEVTLRLTVKGADDRENERHLNRLKQQVLQRVGDFFYGEGDANLATLLVSELTERGLTVGAAESLTGGRFSAALTEVPGVSSVFNGAIVCYSNAVKETTLSVSSQILQKDGAVSASCAKQLAKNVKKTLHSDVGVSFTGVAGPDELEGHSPGTVYIGISTQHITEAYKLHLAGSRENICDRSVKYGLYYLLKDLR
ncbi:competence/damage-inducible protein A [Salipaludibacillus sp. LMS25]|jgi:nicotinamide-nucleotide amidase|uniref:competence/damage-inducible protein A n=1 Tax=Salipaludibacillus sp. LMS25 TaxID=2924031 RepID=UPI0020D07A2A|nr:competence/damage-inducible protein A [Salipaludibacillus sp. LMS25]UTR15032.1 competence/damage-inducible protein A [Salipaludibacillus sp. LMS25]